MGENQQLKQRVSELLEICREWEYKYEKTVDEMRYKFEQEKRDMGDERDKSERLHKEKFESEIKQRESQF